MFLVFSSILNQILTITFLISSIINYTLHALDHVFYTIFVKSAEVLLMGSRLFVLYCQPSYKLAKLFVPLSEPLTYLKTHFWFLKNLNTPLTIASSDVESLFTKIRLQETTELCVQKLFELFWQCVQGLFSWHFNCYHCWVFYFVWWHEK